MWKWLYYNFKYVIIVLFSLLLFFSFKSCTKAIDVGNINFTDFAWVLDPYQYVELYSYTGTNNRSYTSTTWGNFQSEVGYVHKFGALVQNPPMVQNSQGDLQDYFLQPGNLYLVQFNINIGDDNTLMSQSRLLRDYGSYRAINMKLKYLSTNGGFNYVTIEKNNLAYYTVNRMTDRDFQVNFLVTLPNAPSDMNSEYMTLDFWIDVPNCSTLPQEGCGITYLGAGTGRRAGINLFQMDLATSDIITAYLQTVNSSNSVKFQSETKERVDDVLDILENMKGQLADLNQLLDSMDNPELATLRGATSWLPAGPVDSILVMPLNLINSLTNSLSHNTCTPVSLTLPFVNKNINLPCISSIFEQIGFLSLWNWAGVMASAFIVYYYLKSLYKWVDNTLTFRENTQADWGGI